MIDVAELTELTQDQQNKLEEIFEASNFTPPTKDDMNFIYSVIKELNDNLLDQIVQWKEHTCD